MDGGPSGVHTESPARITAANWQRRSMRCCALCAQVGRVAVVQNSSVYFANLFLNVVERWLYIPLKTICTDFSRNQQKSFESRGSVVRQSHSVRFKQSWNNDSRPQKLDNGSQRQASLRTNWIK